MWLSAELRLELFHLIYGTIQSSGCEPGPPHPQLWDFLFVVVLHLFLDLEQQNKKDCGNLHCSNGRSPNFHGAPTEPWCLSSMLLWSSYVQWDRLYMLKGEKSSHFNHDPRKSWFSVAPACSSVKEGSEYPFFSTLSFVKHIT